MSVGTPDLLLDETEIGAVDLVSDEISARSPWELFSRRFREDKFALAGLIFLTLLILVAIFAPLVCKLVGAPGPYFADQNSLDVFGQPTGPSSAHIFGVDQLGRDVFSRVIYGARVSLLVAFVSTFLTTIFGVACGLFAGFYRGWIDTLISRTVDAWLAIPYLLLAIGLASACSFGNGARRADQAGRSGRDRGGRADELDVSGADHPRPGAVDPREGVRRGLALAGRVELPDHRQRAVAQPHRADHRVRVDVPADRDPVRGGAVVPRRRESSLRRRAGAR